MDWNTFTRGFPPPSVHILIWSPKQGFLLGKVDCDRFYMLVSLYDEMRMGSFTQEVRIDTFVQEKGTLWMLLEPPIEED